jgi:hypothetical protein
VKLTDAGARYLERRVAPRRPEDLAHHDIIQFSALTPVAEWRFTRAGTEVRVPLAPRFVTNSADAAIGHAELGGGLTMVLAYQVAPAARSGRLRVVLPCFEPPPLPIQLVYPSSRLLSAKVTSDSAREDDGRGEGGGTGASWYSDGQGRVLRGGVGRRRGGPAGAPAMKRARWARPRHRSITTSPVGFEQQMSRLSLAGGSSGSGP